jgi:hypothetical protein
MSAEPKKALDCLPIGTDQAVCHEPGAKTSHGSKSDLRRRFDIKLIPLLAIPMFQIQLIPYATSVTHRDQTTRFD